jgi:Flp pilus assembly protein TadG
MFLHICTRPRRRAVACVELAVLLPLLAFLFVVTVDFARLFYQYQIMADCARNGALYGSQKPANSTDTAGIQTAALADATNISPTPTVNSTTATDADGNPCVQVTVSWTFQTITSYPGISQSWPLVRTVQMRVTPLAPAGS